MKPDGLVNDLHRTSRTFGRHAAGTKVRLLDEIAGVPRWRRRERSLLGEVLEFLSAYPDNPAVRRGVERLIPHLPLTDVVYEYSYGVVRRLLAIAPNAQEIHWDGLDDHETLTRTLGLVVHPAEGDGLADERMGLEDWFQQSRPAGATDLAFLVALLERSGLPDPVRVHLFESCIIPIRYRGPRPAELRLSTRRIAYQRTPMERDRFPLEPVILRPMAPVGQPGRVLVELALQALCARKLEIYPLIYANSTDAAIVDGGRGVRIALIGVDSEWRGPLESLFCFMVFKNGVPVAYGPVGVFGGSCELGINLFPEFRGGEIRYFAAQLMRVLHHRLGADYFFLTQYGMGRKNPAAIRSGAFWFYRKLGFRPTNPEVEALARAEEARMAADSAYRSDPATLLRLSRTEAYLDLSGGRRCPLDVRGVSAAASRLLAGAARADRKRMISRQATRVGRILGVDPKARAVRALAPVLCLIPDLPAWSGRDRARLARFLRAKDAPSEQRAALIASRHPKLLEALAKVTTD
ncbi:MAG: hypothetical protein HKM89_07910 [Gemmatimonadales bacterium]|nr:hypothetical protein [Gemmatimonadales bacterium]